VFKLFKYLLLILILVALVNSFKKQETKNLVDELPSALHETVNTEIDPNKKELEVQSKYFDMNIRLPDKKEIAEAVAKGKEIAADIIREIKKEFDKTK